MDALTQDQRLIYESALAFARREFGPLAEEMDETDQWPADAWRKLGAEGYLGIAVPEEYGGSGGDYLPAALVCPALSRVSPAIGLSYGAHLNLCAHNLLRNGSEDLKRRYLPGLCAGTTVGALGITEPKAVRQGTIRAGILAGGLLLVIYAMLAHVGALTGADGRQIEALGVRRVLDFRGVEERTSAACALPGVQVHSLAIEPTIVQVLQDLLAAGHALTGAEVVDHMRDTYRGFVRHNSHRFAEFFGHLLASDEPTVFHCTAGKDRTGFAAALVLRVLGATQDAVMRDYLLTNERLKPPPGLRQWLPPEAAAVLYGVRPEFLAAAFDAVEEDFGGVEAYLREGLGLGDAEQERLRALYLQPGTPA